MKIIITLGETDLDSNWQYAALIMSKLKEYGEKMLDLEIVHMDATTTKDLK